MDDNETQSAILDITHTFFDHIGIDPEISIAHDPDTDYYTIQIDTENPGLLIGYRGDTLGAIQHMLSQQIKYKTGDWQKLIVNVGDYRQQREETLDQLALNAAQRVEFSGEPYIFNNLTPPERRIVHMALSEHPAVVTESRGEGRSRQLVVLPK